MFNKDQIVSLYNQYISTYDQEKYGTIWKNQSDRFRRFWNERIMVDDTKELNDQEVDEIIRILDKNAKGSTPETEAVARAMIAQGAWKRMFNEMKSNKILSQIINNIITQVEWQKKAEGIDKLYEFNQGRKNNLTGPSGNAINCFIVAYDPFNNLSVISMNDRRKLIKYLTLDLDNKLEKVSFGSQVALSNKLILDKFRELGINSSARIISDFLYDSHEMKQLWKPEEKKIPIDNDEQIKNVSLGVSEATSEGDPSLFYMEKQLEDFLIENWEKTELGEKYDLIEEGDKFSQQYPTDIGFIDILAKEKNTGRYVVIELKKGQTSDDTIGQLTRYMGWIKGNLSNGKSPKGIIISGKYDERLYWASQMVPDVEVYLYKVSFKLGQFKQ